VFLRKIKSLSKRQAKKTHLDNILRPVFYAWQDFSDRDILRRNECLKDLYKGKRCFLLLTAPSLLEVDPEKLNDEFTFGASHLGCPDLDPRYSSKYGNFLEGIRHWNFPNRYCRVLEQDADILQLQESSRNRHKWPRFTNLSFFAPRTIHGAAFEGSVYNNRTLAALGRDFWSATIHSFPNTTFLQYVNDLKWFEQENLLENRKVYYVHTQPLRSDAKMKVDLTRRIHGKGSFINMVTAAIYMGFKEIYLCGAGYTYQPMQFFTYYYQPSFPIEFPKEKRNKVIDEIMKIEPVSILRIQEDELSYRPIWVDDRPVSDSHRIMNEFARSVGVMIFNIVPDGFESPIYEKITWKEVENNVLS